jgi:hypothetical protein
VVVQAAKLTSRKQTWRPGYYSAEISAKRSYTGAAAVGISYTAKGLSTGASRPATREGLTFTSILLHRQHILALSTIYGVEVVNILPYGVIITTGGVPMSVVLAVKGPHSIPPTQEDYRIRAGMDIFQPESIPGVVWSKPDLTSDEHRIVVKFAIDRKRRPGGQFIPCSMCSENHPKFLAGSVLWSPDGWLRVIGHVCAKKDENFGEARYRTLQRQHDQKELDDAALDLLESNIQFIRPLRKDVAALRDAMEFMEGQQRIFFRSVPTLAGQLSEAARRGGGRLTIVREVSADRFAAADSMVSGLSVMTPMSRYEEVDVGILRGTTFFNHPAKFPRSRQVEGVLLAFDMIPDGEGIDPLYKLIDAGGENQVTVTAITVLRAVKRALALARDYADAADFMSSENLNTREDWGRHPDNGFPFSIQRSNREIIFKLQDLSRARLLLNWPTIVDLSGWRQVAEAGVTLDRLSSVGISSSGGH